MSTTIIISISIYMVINAFLSGVALGEYNEITNKERLMVLVGLFFMLPMVLIHMIFPSLNKFKNLVKDIWVIYFTNKMKNPTKDDVENLKALLGRIENKKGMYTKIRVRLVNVILNRAK
jgi:hypothetical protein